jgi:hypothetical protein
MGRLSDFILFLIAGTILYLLWVHSVDPLPELEGLKRIYWPFLEYMRSSLELGNEFFLLKEKCYRVVNYPSGTALFAWLFAFLKMQKIILKWPQLINIMLLIPLCLSPIFFKLSRRNFWFFALCIYFYPATQICIKQFSLNAWSISYALIALLCLHSHLIRPDQKKLFFAGLFFAVSCAVKHLGPLLLLNFLLIYIVWVFASGRKIDPGIIACCLLSLLVSLPFYNIFSLWLYPQHQVKWHSQTMNFTGFLIIGSAIPLLTGLLIILLQKKGRQMPLPNLCRNGWALLLMTALATGQMIFIPDENFLPLIFISGSVLIALFAFYYNLKSIRGLFYLYIIHLYMNMALLYASTIGRVAYVFFLPLLLILVLTCNETRSRTAKYIITLLIITVANFFPSIDFLKAEMGLAGRRIYFLIFNSSHNPLSWQKCPLSGVRNEFLNILLQREFKKEPLFLVETLGRLVSVQFEFNHGNYLFDFPAIEPLKYISKERKSTDYKQIFTKWQQEGDIFLEKLVLNNDIPLLLRPINPLPAEVDHLQLSLKQILQIPDFNPEKIHYEVLTRAFNEHIFQFLTKSGLLENYYEHFGLPARKPVMSLYVAKSLKKRKGPQINPKSGFYLKPPNKHLRYLAYSKGKSLLSIYRELRQSHNELNNNELYDEIIMLEKELTDKDWAGAFREGLLPLGTR